ncbi:hypothetical protein PFAG_00693 [Plasmodium falciparum Santa Lucia]|uniref:Erythrocyte membrane protein 1 n=1 Tax=Plasmodium falciparum Santa Lucia TaxID=478859 RepID=W7FPT5_PLAFA|nr:hypothetical protein PFAG_00693 [Plasmodium falciparum Santa Lucia]
MAPQGGSGGAHGGGGDDIEDATAKHLLDSIGKIVHDKVKSEAEKRSNGDLKAYVSFATLSGGELAGTLDPCELINDKGENLIDARGDPCGNVSGNGGTGNDDLKRFSKERVAEYDNKKMKCSYGSNGKNEGACAPFRRLHVCDKNLEQIKPHTITATHNLLLDVCLAAKYEGESLKGYHEQYEVQYPSSGSTMCTELARSFADIGDIVRGKDLYSGNKKENKQREKLDKKLKDIFGKIHGNLKDARTHYSDTTNYYKLREDWWTANRSTVWEAITCGAPDYAQYFRGTCGNTKIPSKTPNKCRCPKTSGGKPGANANQVPTYFDYVPQYLRWFEEWAEDFCRKKNKKIKDVQKQCRGTDSSGKKRYCSRNGYDCEKTKRAIGKYRMGNQCISCLYGCNPYVEWIDNQRKQFDKQVKKYADEIKIYTEGASGGSRRQKRAATTTKYDGYEKKFYNILKGGYKDVNNFLEKLSNEEICKKITEKEEGKINFKEVNSGGGVVGGGSASTSDTSGTNDENKGTFYRSKYCQPCPHCGVKKKDGGSGSGWEEKDKSDLCKNINLYRPNRDATPTEIKILKSGEGHEDIKQKIDEFCAQANGDRTNSGGSGDKNGGSDSQKLYEDWNCYKGKDVEKVNNGQDDDDDVDPNYVENAGGLCILKKKKEKKTEKDPDEIQKTYNDFFNFWVAHMLKDSIHWRTEKIKKCLENGTKTRCKNNEKCNRECECFQRWITQKQQEWDAIKKHFNTQDFGSKGGIGNYAFLERAMESPDFVLEHVLDKEVLLTSIKEAYGNAKELEGIKNMLEKENEKNQQEADDGNDSQKKTTIDKLLKHEEDDANNCLQKCQETQKPPAGGGAGGRSLTPAGGATDSGGGHSSEDVEDEEDDDDDDDEDGDENEEDEDKDEVAVEGEEETEEGETHKATEEIITTPDVCPIVKTALTNNDNLNAACSQKYDGKYYGWKCISGDSTTTGKDGATGGSICVPPRTQELCLHYLKQLNDQTEIKEHDMKEAFIKTAAQETYLLWQKYKEDKQNETASTELDIDDPQTQLNDGTIPEEFKRQMFYTFGDYRDLFLGRYIGNDLDKVNNNITAVFQNGDHIPNGQKTDRQRQEFWGTYGKDIWKGMLCALQEAGGKKTLTETYNYSNVTFNGHLTGTKLNEFASRPSFLRWMTEWGDQFCRERITQLQILKERCMVYQYNGDKGKDDKKEQCTKTCEEYKKWITKWKDNYKKQNQRYTEVKGTSPYKEDSDVKESKDAHGYLSKILKNIICTSGTDIAYCNCMEGTSTTDSSNNDNIPESLKYPPIEIEEGCTCKDPSPGEVIPEKKVPEPKVLPKPPKLPKRQPKERDFPTPALKKAMLSSTIMWSIGIGFAAFTYFYLKKKTKSSVGNLFQILQIPKSDYDIPTLKSSNRYIPYASDRYKGKTYIYMEGDSDEDKYAFMSDTTDITSSESEYEELDINDIYVPGSPKYKTLIEVVLEPSKRDTMSTQSDIPLNDKLDSNKLTDEEWNQLKQDFISILQNPQNDLPQNNISGNIQMDTHPSVSILHDDMEEKPFITSIHDRDLHNGEEVTYNINLDDHKNMNFSTNHDNIPPKNNQNDLYTGIDLINDSISGNHNVDIYDELLKRKENELFGTNHTKHTTTNSITKKTHNDPIVNQINLFHKWLDRHKNMCEQWDKNKKEELLDKLKKEWEQDYNNNSGDIHTSDNNIVSTVNHVFNTDVSIQIEMDDPNPVNPFTNMYTNSDNSTMDNILNGMEKHREPYFYDIYEDDITYFDIDDEKTPMGDIYVDHNNVNSNNMDVPNKVHIEMNIVNNKKEIFEEEYPISDIWNI